MSVGSFADEPTTNLKFKDYNLPEDVSHALDTLQFNGGKTSVAKVKKHNVNPL